MVTAAADKARRGSFNAFFWVRVWVLGEELCFMGEGEMRTEGNGESARVD